MAATVQKRRKGRRGGELPI